MLVQLHLIQFSKWLWQSTAWLFLICLILSALLPAYKLLAQTLWAIIAIAWLVRETPRKFPESFLTQVGIVFLGGLCFGFVAVLAWVMIGLTPIFIQLGVLPNWQLDMYWIIYFFLESIMAYYALKWQFHSQRIINR